MAKKSSKAMNISKRGKTSKKGEPQTLGNNVSPRPKRLGSEPCEKSPLLERAEELADQLPLNCPHFVKLMLRSHVTRGFWLGLPVEFCRKHLGTRDQTILLEDENGEKFNTTYLGHKMGLSAGWKGFSLHHNLNEGDVLVFQKVKLHEFKVYIVKPNGPKRVKRATGNAENSRIVAACSSSSTSDLSEDLLYVDNVDENTESEGESEDMFDFIDNDEAGADGEYSDYFITGAEVSESAVTSFKKVTCMKKFEVIFNGMIINSQIPKVVLNKYYRLCRSQNSYLHENLMKSLDSQLVSGLISETVNISDAIKFSKITTEESEFSTWGKTLQASEMFGMNVGFMRSRASKLASLAAQAKMHKDARHARELEEAELRARLADLLRVKDKEDREESEKSAQIATSFKEVINVPW